MTKQLWKLDNLGERMWIMSNMIAQQSATLGRDGFVLSVVAEETRGLANRLHDMVEKAMFEGEELKPDVFINLAKGLNFLALNTAIEAYRWGHRGKQTAVCAEEIRNLSFSVTGLFDKELEDKRRNFVAPSPKNPLTTVNESFGLFYFSIAGTFFVENLLNVREVIRSHGGYKNGCINLRGQEIPVVDGYKLMGREAEKPAYIILRTPWATPDKTYAIAADADGLDAIYSSVGTPVPPPADMKLAKYVRECWESESGEPFYFMDWPKMV